MKRRMALFLTALVLLAAMAAEAFAADVYVADEGGILSQSDRQALERRAKEISDLYDCDVCIVTMYDYRDYGSGSARSCAERYFTDQGLGRGSDENGVLLLLSMAERDYALIAHGDFANMAFTDYGKDVLSEEFLDDFRYDDWYGGFVDYLEGSERLMDTALRGEPVDVSRSGGGAVLVVLLVPLVVAAIACIVMVVSMKTARMQSHANAYIPDGGIRVTHQSDHFVNRTVVRHRIESNSSGGGTRVNSGGFSGKSGKF